MAPKPDELGLNLGHTSPNFKPPTDRCVPDTEIAVKRQPQTVAQARLGYFPRHQLHPM